MEHVGVLCDICHKKVTGFRFKCLECRDYDLCSFCELNHHSEHLLIRLERSLNQFDSNFLEKIMQMRSLHKNNLLSCEILAAVTCDNNCRMVRLPNSLYKCVECLKNFCSQCQKQSICTANKNHFLIRFANSTHLNNNLQYWLDVVNFWSYMNHGLPCHQGIYCNVCNNKNILGIRFKCIDCPDFDLCSQCEPTNFHSDHLLARIASPVKANSHSTIVLKKMLAMRSSPNLDIFVDGHVKRSLLHSEARQLVQHNGITCDECGNEIFGFRYKCVVCLDYDLCSLCQREGRHKIHLLIRFSEPVNQSILNEHFLEAVMQIGSPLKPISTSQSKSQPNKQKCIKEKVEEKVEGRTVPMCTICLDKPSNMVILSCGHLCICSECVGTFNRQSKQCPICRAAIKSVQQAYF